MKKVLVYSLLLALITLNALPIKAMATKSAMSTLISDPRIAAFGALGFWIIGCGSIYLATNKFAEAYNHSQAKGDARTEHSRRQMNVAAEKTAVNYAAIYTIAGVASLFGAGYLIYTIIKDDLFSFEPNE
jgi:hypothetical protein